LKCSVFAGAPAQLSPTLLDTDCRPVDSGPGQAIPLLNAPVW